MRPQQSPSPHHRRRPPPTYDEERHQEGESQMACLAPPNTATPPRTPDPQPAKCPLFLATSPSRRPNAATPTMANRRNTPQDHHLRPLPRSPLCIPPRRSHKIPSTGRRSPPIQRTSMRATQEESYRRPQLRGLSRARAPTVVMMGKVEVRCDGYGRQPVPPDAGGDTGVLGYKCSQTVRQ
jgi:hypothetical protein